MRNIHLGFIGAAALTAASAANAGVTLGATGMTQGSSTGGVTSSITDNVGNPNKVEFDTNNAAAGTDTSYFDFLVDYDATGVFSVTTATTPDSTVTLIDLLTGMPVYGTLVANNSGTSYSLNLTTSLINNTWYRFTYSANMATAGDISGTANFYVSGVPEPATWALMLLGFAGIGFAMRRTCKPVFAQLA